MKFDKTFLERHKKMQARDRLYGTTTLGARGQVVIPARARKDLQLKPGDQLIVMGKFGKALGLMKAGELQEFIKEVMDHISGSPIEPSIKGHLKKLFKPLQKHKSR